MSKKIEVIQPSLKLAWLLMRWLAIIVFPTWPVNTVSTSIRFPRGRNKQKSRSLLDFPAEIQRICMGARGFTTLLVNSQQGRRSSLSKFLPEVVRRDSFTCCITRRLCRYFRGAAGPLPFCLIRYGQRQSFYFCEYIPSSVCIFFWSIYSAVPPAS